MKFFYGLAHRYPDGLSVSSYLRSKPLAVLSWALGIVLYAHILHQVTQPACHASLNHSTVRQRKVRFNLTEEASAPSLFPFSCIIYLRLA